MCLKLFPCRCIGKSRHDTDCTPGLPSVVEETLKGIQVNVLLYERNNIDNDKNPFFRQHNLSADVVGLANPQHLAWFNISFHVRELLTHDHPKFALVCHTAGYF
jgi:hypothetical protein